MSETVVNPDILHYCLITKLLLIIPGKLKSKKKKKKMKITVMKLKKKKKPGEHKLGKINAEKRKKFYFPLGYYFYIFRYPTISVLILFMCNQKKKKVFFLFVNF